MKVLGLETVKENEERTRLPVNGYVCRIKSVADNAASEYLKFEFDIAEGEFKGYYAKLEEAINIWLGNFIKSYKEAALPFFKAFVTAVENSNAGFKFIDGQEQGFNGKLVGLVMREEEYRKPTTGEVVINVKVDEVRSADKIRSGDFKIKPLKKLEDAAPAKVKVSELKPLTDEDIPF